MPLDTTAVEALIARARREIDSGLLPAAQFAVAYNGETVVSEALGDCTTESRFHTYSAVKPTVALTAMELAAEGHFEVAAPVSDVLESFGANGKQSITVSQVMLHEGGFPYAPMRPEAMADRDARLDAYGEWYTDWEPGTRFEYHPLSAHWVLADIISEVTGRPFADVITERLTAPVGAGRWLGVEPDAASDVHADVMDVIGVGTEPSAEELAAIGLTEMPDLGVSEAVLAAFNDPWLRAVGVPGGGGIASATQVAMWYQAVLHNTGDLLRPEVRADALTVRQNMMDWTGVTVNRSHAFVLAGDDGKAGIRGHASGASPQAFGHSGAKGQIGWADPKSGISFAYLTNGLDRNDLAWARRRVAFSNRALAVISQ